jgi:pilus assembly protein Flp/PilA
VISVQTGNLGVAAERSAKVAKQPNQESWDMTNLVARFVKDESGATAIEYGLIAMLISVAVIGILGAVGTNLTSTFTSVNNALSH